MIVRVFLCWVRSLPVFSLELAGRELLVFTTQMLSSSAATKYPLPGFAIRPAKLLCPRAPLSQLHSSTDAESLRISGEVNIIDFKKVVSAGVSLRFFFFFPLHQMRFHTTDFPIFSYELYLS